MVGVRERCDNMIAVDESVGWRSHRKDGPMTIEGDDEDDGDDGDGDDGDDANAITRAEPSSPNQLVNLPRSKISQVIFFSFLRGRPICMIKGCCQSGWRSVGDTASAYIMSCESKMSYEANTRGRMVIRGAE